MEDDQGTRPAPEATAAQREKAKMVLERWKKCDDSLVEERRNFWLNLAFFEGHQMIQWDRRNNQVVPYTGADEPRTRIKINKIQERINQLVGRFVQRTLAFEGHPNSADDSTIAGSRLGESILEAARVEQDWDGLREEEVFYTLMGGTSAVSVEWNPTEQGVVEQSTSGSVSNTEDVELSAWSIVEFSVEGGSRNWRKARWWIGSQALPPKQVKARYKLDWCPTADAMGDYSPLQRELLNGRRGSDEKDLCSVFTLYERPNPECKNGRHIVVVNERIVVDEDWPFAFTNRLNLWVFRQVKVPMKWTGVTIASEARAPQVAYNAVRSTIVEHAKKVSNIRIMSPHGALDDNTDLTDEPGEIVNYWPQEGAKPEYMGPPDLPRWLTQEPERLEAELDGILHTHAVSRGEAPGDRNSGLALSILAEKNDTPLGPMSRDQANGWGAIGSLALEIFQDKVKKQRTTVVHGDSGVALAYEWNGQRLQGQTRVTVPLDATLPTSRAATQSMLVNLAQSFPQISESLTTPTLAKLLDLPGSKLIGQVNDPDVSWAHIENELLAAGEPRLPKKWEDHAVHMAEHNAFRKTKAFDAADENVKKIFELHLAAHQRLIEEEATEQAAVNAINPGFAGLPQADAPIGSMVPPPAAAQSAV